MKKDPSDIERIVRREEAKKEFYKKLSYMHRPPNKPSDKERTIVSFDAEDDNDNENVNISIREVEIDSEDIDDLNVFLDGDEDSMIDNYCHGNVRNNNDIKKVLIETKQKHLNSIGNGENVDSLFLPGDSLVSVDGENVEGMELKEIEGILEHKRCTNVKVTLQVKSLPEVAELNNGSNKNMDVRSKREMLKRSRRIKFKDKINIEEFGNEEEQENYVDESMPQVVWVKHNSGIVPGILLSTDPISNKVKVKLDQVQIEIEIDQSMVEKANPAEYDRVENLDLLNEVNQSGLINTLRHRYHSNLVHTFAGEVMIVINPCTPLYIYSKKIMSIFKKSINEGDLIPHIYATAQSALTDLFKDLFMRNKDHPSDQNENKNDFVNNNNNNNNNNTILTQNNNNNNSHIKNNSDNNSDNNKNNNNKNNNQTIILMGPKGSGKSTNLSNILEYYVSTALAALADVAKSTCGSTERGQENMIGSSDTINVEQVKSAIFLLESFTNYSTLYNDNSSGSCLLAEARFNEISGHLDGLMFNIQNLETSRLTRRVDHRRCFHVFYYMLAGVGEAERNSLHLTNSVLREPNLFLMTSNENEQLLKSGKDKWLKLMRAMGGVGVSEKEVMKIVTVLAVIYHIGAAGYVIEKDKYSFGRLAAASRAASLLGISVGQLSQAIFGSAAMNNKDNFDFKNNNKNNSQTNNNKNDNNRNNKYDNDNNRNNNNKNDNNRKYNKHHENEDKDDKSDNRCDDDKDTCTDKSEGMDGMDGMCVFVEELYAMLCEYVVSIVNRFFKQTKTSKNPNNAKTSKSKKSILIVDASGFREKQHPVNHLGFEDFRCNYLQDRINLFCYDKLITEKMELYKEEFDKSFPSISDDVTSHKNLLNSVKNMEKKMSNIESLVSSSAMSSPSSASKESSSITSLPSSGSNESSSVSKSIKFVHQFEGACVEYDLRDLMKHAGCEDDKNNNNNNNKNKIKNNNNKNNNVNLKNVMSRLEEMLSLSSSTSSTSLPTSSPSSFSSSSLSSSSLSSSFTHFRTNVDSLMGELNKRRSRFVFCWLPQPPSLSEATPTTVDLATLKRQLQSTCILQATQLHSLTFSNYFSYAEFCDLFGFLMPVTANDISVSDPKKMTEEILKHFGIEEEFYKMGRAKVFLKNKALGKLKTSRQDKLTNWIVGLQSVCRMRLASKDKMKMSKMDAVSMNTKSPDRHVDILNATSIDDENSRIYERGDDSVDRGNNINKNNINNNSQNPKNLDFYNNNFDPFNNNTDFPSNSNNNINNNNLKLKQMRMKHLEDVDEYEMGVLNAKKKLSEAMDEVGDTKHDLDRVQIQMVSKNKVIEGLKSMIEEQACDYDLLSDQCSSLQKELARQNKALGEERVKYEGLEGDLRGMQEQNELNKELIENAMVETERESDGRREMEDRLKEYLGIKHELEEIESEKEVAVRSQQRQQHRLNQQDDTIKKLIETINELERSNQETKKTAMKNEEEAEEDMKNRKRNLYLEIQQANQRMDEAEDEKARTQTELEAKSKQLNQLKQELLNFKKDRRRRNSRLKYLVSSTKDSTLQNNWPQKHTAKLKSMLSAVEEENSGLKERKRLMGEEMNLMQEEMECWEGERREHKNRIDRLSTEMHETSELVEEKEDEITDLLHKYAKLVDKNSIDLTKLQEQSEEIQGLNTKVSECLTHIETLENKNTQLSASAVNAQTLSSLANQMSNLKMALQEEEIGRRRTESQLKYAKSSLQKEKQENQNLKCDLKKQTEVKSKVDGSLKVQKSRCLALETRIQDLETIIKQLRRQIDGQKDECRDHSEEMTGLKRRLGVLQSNIYRMECDDDDSDDDEGDDDEGDDVFVGFKRNSVVLSSRRSLLDSSEA